MSETPVFSLFDKCLTLTADSNHRDAKPSSSNLSADGIEEPSVIEIDLLNICDRAFYRNSCWVKAVKCFAKNAILDVYQVN